MFKLHTLFAIVLATLTSHAYALSVATPPSVSVCVPTQITWTGAADGTIYLSIQSSADPNGQAIEQLNTSSGSEGTYIWNVNVQPNQSIQYKITDSSGQFSFSNVINVNDSSDKSCLNASASSSSSSSTTASTKPTTGASASSTTTTTKTSEAATGSSETASNSSTTSSTPSTSTAVTHTSGTTTNTTSTEPKTTTSSTTTSASNGAYAVVPMPVLAAVLAGPVAASMALLVLF